MSSLTKSNEDRYFIGLMSGTSADSIDAAIFNFSHDGQTHLIGSRSHPLKSQTRHEIFNLFQPGNNEIQRLGSLDVCLAKEFAEAVKELCRDCNIAISRIEAIGSHGQTIRHSPRRSNNSDVFTLQIGDANTLANETQIPVVADFRRKDMACGGQGAPLVPAFHNAVFRSRHENRCIVNVGGMSNVSILPITGKVTGFDTGPGNALMDSWITLHKNQAYDNFGEWASSGAVNNELLTKLLAHAYFHRQAPKSTGREEFHLAWVDQILATLPPIEPEDVQATLAELTAITITNDIPTSELDNLGVYLCGGGAHNTHLIIRLRQLQPLLKIQTTEVLGIHPDWVEAGAFAWLAMQRMDGKPGNLPSVTGASKEAILGGLYLP